MTIERDELGFDAAINYKTDDIRAALKEHCPKGIDIYFDNVGGEILDLCLARLANRARVVICGGISRYNLEGEIPGPKNYFNLVFRSARMEGFLLTQYLARFDEGREALQGWLQQLPASMRSTVSLRVEHGLSYEEIGHMLGRSAVATRKRFSRAIGMLRELAGAQAPQVLG